MKKLFNADILDLFETDSGFVYACKETIDGSNDAIAFITYDMKADKFDRIPVNAYIKLKFGENGFALARELGDFVTCKLLKTGKNENVAAYDDGTIKLFNDYGIITGTQKAGYMDSPAASAEPVGRDLWMSVPEQNAVIKYSVKFKRIEFRVGSKNEKAFSHPTGISYYDNCLYVCNPASYKIRTVGLETYKVSDYAIFNEPVFKYMRIKGKELVLLNSGLYIL